jgi:hypothetical protein
VKGSFAGFTYRQKETAIRLLANLVVLAAFVVYVVLYQGTHDYHAFFFFAFCVPMLYQTVTAWIRADMSTDERDSEIQGGGDSQGYFLLSLGIFFLLMYPSDNAHTLPNKLFVLWMLSSIVASGKQLRLYAGHRSWLPDSFGEWLRRRARNRIENPTPRQREIATRWMEREQRRKDRK